MLDFDSIRLEIKELRNVIGDEDNRWTTTLYTTDQALMNAWIACKKYDTQDSEGVCLSTHHPDYKTVNKELYSALVEMDDAIFKMNSIKERIGTLINEIRDSSNGKGVWALLDS